MSLIQVKNLTFTYDGSYEPVFENASFQIDTGFSIFLTHLETSCFMADPQKRPADLPVLFIFDGNNSRH